MDPSFRHRFIVALVFLLLTLILVVDYLPQAVQLEEGQVSTVDISAPVTTTFLDEIQTEKRKEEVASQVDRVFEEDATIIQRVEEEITGVFNSLWYFRDMGLLEEIPLSQGMIDSQEEGPIDPIAFIQTQLAIPLSQEVIEYALITPREDLEFVQEKVLEILLPFLRRGIREDALEEVKGRLQERVYAYGLLKRNERILEEMVLLAVRPTFVYNEEETQRRREEAAQAVEPVERTIRQGENIIRQGEVVGEEHIQALEVLDLIRPQVNVLTIIGLILMVGIFLGVVTIYIHRFHFHEVAQGGILVLISLLPVLLLLLARVLTLLPIQDPGLLVPLGTVSMLITILIGSQLAFIILISLSFLVALVTGGGMMQVAVGFMGGMAGIFSVSRVSQRSDMVRAGFYVGLAVAITAITFSFVDGTWNLFQVLRLAFLGIINGVMAAIFTNGSLPFLENSLGMVSAVKLLELSNPHHPLLKRLLIEAPGTYHHSVIVGNLAEAGAEEVGADTLLTRVAAYYHDIGKIRRPYFFTENQFGGDNPHDRISPNLSTIIIKNHVKEGVELAVKHRLPMPIVDIIRQHHGTNLVSFFYEEARQGNRHDRVEEVDFSYEGPRPQTKEAALIMLADVVEASVRSESLNRLHQGRIDTLVKDMIQEKLNRGQLDQCDLTLKDLDRIGKAFVTILSGIFHQRVEYPDHDEKDFLLRHGRGR